jgi:hypothetical protein
MFIENSKVPVEGSSPLFVQEVRIPIEKTKARAGRNLSIVFIIMKVSLNNKVIQIYFFPANSVP